MLLVLSPAKTLDETTVIPDKIVAKATQLSFQNEAGELVKILRNHSAAQISSLMKVSDKIAALNVSRYESYSAKFTDKNARPALWTFKGDVYTPMAISDYSMKSWDYAQHHVRILSGLYGLLRPLDLMQPYRLEMGTRLENKKGKNLYEFWGSKVSEAINEAQAESKTPLLVNLASEEYAKVIDKKALKSPMVTIHFKENKGGQYKTIGIHAKKARGTMADYTIRNQVGDPEKLKLFNLLGYKYTNNLSDEKNWVFVR